MEVGARCGPGGAHRADHLALVHGLPRLHLPGTELGVESGKAVFVGQLHIVAVDGVKSGCHHHAAQRRQDRGALRRRNVHAGVAAFLSGDRVNPGTKEGGDLVVLRYRPLAADLRSVLLQPGHYRLSRKVQIRFL